MKIKIYFVTYDNDFELIQTLKSFEKSGIKNYDYEITIVNNHKDKKVELDNIDLTTKVIDNNTRPIFSTGHLSRNWNECLIDGFVDVNNPEADIVILCQNDVSFNEDVIDTLIEYHKTYSFITGGSGDAFHSYTIDAIKSVGLWDERFCNIGWQESDYFLRQIIYNKNSSSVNDFYSDRLHNYIPYNFLNQDRSPGYNRGDQHHLKSLKHHIKSSKVFYSKWSDIPITGWQNLPEIGFDYIKSPQWIMYPYFESAIDNLNNKNYMDYGNE